MVDILAAESHDAYSRVRRREMLSGFYPCIAANLLKKCGRLNRHADGFRDLVFQRRAKVLFKILIRWELLTVDLLARIARLQS